MVPVQPKTQLAPEKLIGDDGRPHYGHFDGIVRELGERDFALQTCMDKPASALSRHFGFKQFQFVSVVTPRYVIGVAMADIRYVGSAFCYLYDIQANRLAEKTWLKPLSWGYRVATSAWAGEARFSNRKGAIRFTIERGEWHLSIQSDAIRAELNLSPSPLSLPMAMCNPTGYNGWTYTQKHNGLKCTGTLTVHDEAQPLNMALAGYDFSAGFMRRDTSWRWASINAHIHEGVMGLNLAAGVNETGTTENVFWINGERHLLGPVHFDFSRQSGNAANLWRVFSDNGQVDLEFTVRQCRSEKLNLVLLKSNFRQNLGFFNGRITDNAGREYRLDNVLGLTEDHYARW